MFLAGRRLVAIDGTCLDVADTPGNAEFFGRPGSACGEQAAFPQARLVALAECVTHALLDATVGPCRTSEIELSRQLVARLEPGMLVLADRGFYGFRLWEQAAATGADLLWRVKTTLRPRYLETLSDGSWLARIGPTSGTGWAKATLLMVRVIDYAVDDGRDNPEEYRLLTTSWIRPKPPPPTSPPRTSSGGRSSLSSMSSRPTSAVLAPCCARNPPIWFSKRSGGTCAVTTRSEP